MECSLKLFVADRSLLILVEPVLEVGDLFFKSLILFPDGDSVRQRGPEIRKGVTCCLNAFLCRGNCV